MLRAEGTVPSPIPLRGNKTNYGQVDGGKSYYAFSVSAGTAYQVQFKCLTADASLQVYDGDDGFNTAVCSDPWTSSGFSPSGRACPVTAVGNTLYVAVERSAASGAGAFYSLCLSNCGSGGQSEPTTNLP